MDILTQGVLGAALSQSVAKKNQYRIAALVGFLSGLLADADVFISSSVDPLLTLEYHRHFTHSLFFIPIGALIAAVLLYYPLKKQLQFSRLYLYCFAGYSFSGFIDLCTSYGTYYLWPFYDQRISFNIISIVDPIFTLALIAGVVIAIVKRSHIAARVGLVFAASYLVLAAVQHQRALNYATEITQSRGHSVEKILVKPTFANILLWRMVYIADDKIYVDGIRMGFDTVHYQGESVKRFVLKTELPDIAVDSVLYRDIKRFSGFSNDYIARHPDNPNILGDIRYSILPISARPLWGITINTEYPDQHVEYGFYRNNTSENRELFKNMVLGK